MSAARPRATVTTATKTSVASVGCFIRLGVLRQMSVCTMRNTFTNERAAKKSVYPTITSALMRAPADQSRPVVMPFAVERGDSVATNELVRRCVEQVGDVTGDDQEEPHVRYEEQEDAKTKGGREHRPSGLDVVTERVERHRNGGRRLALGLDSFAAALDRRPHARRPRRGRLGRVAGRGLVRGFVHGFIFLYGERIRRARNGSGSPMRSGCRMLPTSSAPSTTRGPGRTK